MAKIDQREALRALMEERREDYAGLSRLLGRNAAYIHQFIKRGSPKRLAEADALRLARYFDVEPEALGVASISEPQREELRRVPRLNVAASAGYGANVEGETSHGHLAFDRSWLRQLTGGSAEGLRFIRVQGDSMSPTLSDGDDILVNEADAADRVRDGIYVLRVEDNLMVKRLALSPADRTATIKSDNPSYPDWQGCELASITIIGRVIWAGRRVS